MAAPIPISAPRRKLATYGKTSRKRIDGYGVENQHPRSTTSIISYGTDTQSVISRQNAEIKAAVLFAGNVLAPAKADNWQENRARIVPNNTAITTRDAKPDLAQRNPRMEGLVKTGSRSKELKTTSGPVFTKRRDELRMYDFLSSDEETESKRTTMVRPRPNPHGAAVAQRSAYPRLPGTSLTGVTGAKRGQVLPDQSCPPSSKKRKLGTYSQGSRESTLSSNDTAQPRNSVFLRYRASKHDSDDTDESFNSHFTSTPVTPMTSKSIPATDTSPSIRRLASITPKPVRNRNDYIDWQEEENSPSNRPVWHERQASSDKALPKKPRPAQQLPGCGPSIADDGGYLPAPVPSTPPKLKRTQSAMETPRAYPTGDQLGGDAGSSPNARSTSFKTSPRHTALWGQLLEGDAEHYDPSVLPMNRLGLSPHKSKKDSREEGDRDQSAWQLSTVNGNLDKCRPRRLIDSLKVRARGEAKIEPTETSDIESNDASLTEPVTGSSDLQSARGRTLERQESMKSSEEMSINSQTCSQPSTSQTIMGMQPGGPKVTYARQRSYLSETSLDEELLSQTLPDSQVSSCGQARRRRGIGPPVSLERLGSFAEEDDASGSGHIKSIHELREAGGTKRFMDEFEGMLEDIDDRTVSAMSTRRANLLELATKLSKNSNARRFLDLGLDKRLFRHLGTEHDIISSCVFASILLQLYREGLEAHSILHICQEGAFDMLTRSLRISQDIMLIAKDRRNGISKVSQALVSSFRTLVKQLPSWTKTPGQISPRAVALVALESLVKSLREAGDTYHTLSPETIDVILSIIYRIPGWQASEPVSAQEILEIETAISIFDACTMVSGLRFGSNTQEATWTLTIMKWLLFVAGNPPDEFKQIQLSVLRLVLNVTNHSSSLCDTLSSPAVITTLARTINSEFRRQAATLDSDEEDVYSVDYLILTLATMTNLLEFSNSIWDHISGEQVDGTTVLDALLQPFLRGLKRTAEADSMEETHFNVAFGYLSVLLSNLCLRDDMRPQICSRMPGQTIQPILGAAIEFLQYNQQVDSQMSNTNGSGGGGSQDGFTEKLQDMIERLMGA